MPQNKWASLRTACLLYEPHSQGSWQEAGTSLSILATRKSRATKGRDFSSITAHLPTFWESGKLFCHVPSGPWNPSPVWKPLPSPKQGSAEWPQPLIMEHLASSCYLQILLISRSYWETLYSVTWGLGDSFLFHFIHLMQILNDCWAVCTESLDLLERTVASS